MDHDKIPVNIEKIENHNFSQFAMKSCQNLYIYLLKNYTHRLIFVVFHYFLYFNTREILDTNEISFGSKIGIFYVLISLILLEDAGFDLYCHSR